MRRAFLCVTAVMVSLAACSAESPRESSAPPQHRAEPPERVGSGTPASSSIPPRGALAKGESIDGCPEAMENSPAVFDAASGTYMVLITDFRSPDSPVTFDVVQWMGGDRARQAFEEDTGDPRGPPNDYYIRNESTKTRSANFAPDARLLLTHWPADPIDLEPASVDEFPAYLQSMPGQKLFWLTFEGGGIVEACEQWTP